MKYILWKSDKPILFGILIGFFFLSCDKKPLNNSKIVGQVTLDGKAASGAQVGIKSRLVTNTTTCDASGSYSFAGLSLGDYTLGASVTATVTGSDSVTTHVNVTATAIVQINSEAETDVANFALLTPPPGSGGGGGGGGGSCPYIYVFNGESYVFKGDIYAGAIYPNLERDDYTPLDELKVVDGIYKIKISNELNEKQYTNFADLMIIKHAPHVKILFDKAGNVLTLTHERSAFSIVTENYVPVTNLLNCADGNSYLFNETSKTELSWFESGLNYFVPQRGKSAIICNFEKEKGAQQAKLLVKAKNSNWSVFVWEEFIKFFGTYFDSWNSDQLKRSANELLDWRLEEGVPMMVYIETDKGWEYADCFNIVGSVISREMIMSLNLSKVKGNTVKIKIECAYMFWELDYLAIDYTENAPCELEIKSPAKVSFDNKGEKLKQLLSNDNLYLQHLNKGLSDELYYTASSASEVNSKCSYFLHTRGYYEQIVSNTNPPQYLTLIGFMRPGSFAEYSYERFQELRNFQSLAKK